MTSFELIVKFTPRELLWRFHKNFNRKFRLYFFIRPSNWISALLFNSTHTHFVVNMLFWCCWMPRDENGVIKFPRNSSHTHNSFIFSQNGFAVAYKPVIETCIEQKFSCFYHLSINMSIWALCRVLWRRQHFTALNILWMSRWSNIITINYLRNVHVRLQLCINE